MSQTDATVPSDDQVREACAVLARAGARRVQTFGYHFQPNDFYSPCNDVAFLQANPDLWHPAGDPRDIDWNVARQREVVAEVGRYVEELRDIPQESGDDRVFAWRNPFWNNADALVQYGLVRSRKPRRVVETGCGWSSLLLAKALMRNAAETGQPAAEVTQIEPYPRRHLLSALPSHWKLQDVPLQRATMDVFEALGRGDVLFYDGSHCSKAASDVNWFFFEVLPRVRAGVLIHIHDIFFPLDYPDDWVINRVQTWNEQYVLQAFLMNNPRYRIELCNRYMVVREKPLVDAAYKGVQPSLGCSIWLEKQ